MLPLTNEERKLVEENLGLVGKVIQDRVSLQSGIGAYSYEDLFQIGCLGLCKAAQTNKPGRGAFSTYAYTLIRNEIYNELERSTRYQREVSDGQIEHLLDTGHETLDQQLRCKELLQLLDEAEAAATGITAKGIQALRMMLDGYSCKEISASYHTTPNNVTAWMSKGRKFLMNFTATGTVA